MKQSLILIAAIVLFSCKSKLSHREKINLDSTRLFRKLVVNDTASFLDTATLKVSPPETTYSIKFEKGDNIRIWRNGVYKRKRVKLNGIALTNDTIIPIFKKYNVPWSANPISLDSTSSLYNAHIDKFIGLWVYGDTLHSRPKTKFPSNADSVFAAMLGPPGNRYASRDSTGITR